MAVLNDILVTLPLKNIMAIFKKKGSTGIEILQLGSTFALQKNSCISINSHLC